jgi:predicted aspartyl protease
MGETYVDATVRGPLGERHVTLLVDSGAQYTLLPQDVWESIGLEPSRTERFMLVGRIEIERGISECQITLRQGQTTTTVILGERDDEALLGVVTLEELGFALDPFKRRVYKPRLRI